MESSRKYPRSLEQAFGPYTARRIDVEPPRSSLRAWAVYLAIFALAIAGAMLAGCGVREDVLSPAPPMKGVRSFGPDEHGVVCYQPFYNGASISCVKVK